MVNVLVDVADVGVEAAAGDRVVFMSPTFREWDGRLISTAPIVVPLTDGKASVELVPGPVVVRFDCRNVADSQPRTGIVPDTDSVILMDVLRGELDYSEPVLAEMRRMLATVTELRTGIGVDAGRVESAKEGLDDALERADELIEARDLAKRSADAAAGAADTASKSATNAKSSADAAEVSARSAGESAAVVGRVDGQIVRLEELSGGATETLGRMDGLAQRAEKAAAEAGSAVEAEVLKLKGTAPEAFDTLGEIAAELAANESERAALTAAISKKADKSELSELHAEIDQDLMAKATRADLQLLATKQEVATKADLTALEGVAYKSDLTRYMTADNARKVFLFREEAKMRPALFSGNGAPPASLPYAAVGDMWLDLEKMEIYRITGV